MGRQTQHRDRLLRGMASIVILGAIIFCPPASAQDYRTTQRGTLVAQAGSTGGIIGKTDKSISDDGGRSSSSSTARPNRSAKQTSNKEESLPKTIRINERAFGLNYSITLQNVGGKNYQGTWSHGYVTKFTVTAFTNDSMKMKRTDNPAFGSVTGSYTGSRTGNGATGQAVISNGVTSSWDASW